MDPNLLSDGFRESSPETQLLSDPQSTLENSSSAVERFLPQISVAREASIQPSSNQTGAVISKIEQIFESITDCILEEKKELSIRLKSRPRSQGDDKVRDTNTQKGRRKNGTILITFPSKNPQEAWKFAALLRILELSHEALVTGIVTTKRSNNNLLPWHFTTFFKTYSRERTVSKIDMYYKEPELFMKQAVVDRYVDDIAYTFGVGREALNVVAAAKGLVIGACTAMRPSGSSTDFGTEPEGILIPNQKEICEIHILDVEWILVIEKEATFRTLATNGYWKDSLAGKGILVTGKGYPDIQTRHFVHFLSKQHPLIPIYALMDSDPDGIGIMSTYTYGSMNLAHESDLVVPSIKWLGVRSSDFLNTSSDAQGLLKLSARDRRIATKMLQRDSIREEGGEIEWRRELQVMLMMNIKAEVQILGTGARLGEWLDEKLLLARRRPSACDKILPRIASRIY